MKKISDWLKTLPDGHREICLANFERSGLIDEPVKTLHLAIDLGCNWMDEQNTWKYFEMLCWWAFEPGANPLPSLPKLPTVKKQTFGEHLKNFFR